METISLGFRYNIKEGERKMTDNKSLSSECLRCKKHDVIYAKGICHSCYMTLRRNPNAILRKPYNINFELEVERNDN